MVPLGDRIRRARELRGWSTREASRKLRVHRSVIRAWERGQSRPRPEDEELILQELGVCVRQEE